MVRRTFLKNIIKLFFLFLSVVSVTIFSLFTYPWKIRKKELVFHDVMDEEKLPIKGVRQVFMKYIRNDRPINSKAFLVNTGKDLFALSPVCTHLGCLVSWHRPKGKFLCPCHGGQYDMEGNVADGPPPAPLKRLPMKVEKGKVYIGLRI
jgi:cytochrome b6-f complex iron-sulfur subunit